MLSSFHDLDNKFDRVVHIFFEVVFLIFYGFVIQNPVLFKIKFCFFFIRLSYSHDHAREFWWPHLNLRVFYAYFLFFIFFNFIFLYLNF